MARKPGTVTPNTGVKNPAGGVTAPGPGSSGFPGGTIVSSGTTATLDPGDIRELSTSDGHVRSYSVNPGGLKVILRSEADRTFTLANSAAHYGSVLSMIIAAAAKDEMVVIGWMPVSVRNGVPFVATLSDTPVAAVGLGTEPPVV